MNISPGKGYPHNVERKNEMPENTGAGSDSSPSTTTRWVRPDKKVSIHPLSYRRRWWGTLSKGLLKSSIAKPSTWKCLRTFARCGSTPPAYPGLPAV